MTPVVTPPMESGPWPADMRKRAGSAPSRILYVRLDGIGDAVLSGCLLEGLAAVWPGVPVTAVCDIPVAPIFEASPFIDTVIPLVRSRLLEDAYRAEAIVRLAGSGADMAFNGVLSPSGPVADVLAGLPMRLVSLPPDSVNMPPAERDAFTARIDSLIPINPGPRRELAAYADALAWLGAPEIAARPRLWLRPADEAAAGELWEESGLTRGKTIALFAAGAMAEKGYAGYGDALASVCREQGLGVAALGAGRDAALAEMNLEPLRARGVRTANLCANGSMLSSAAFLRDCRLALGADTGMSHIACALGIPLAVLVSGAFFGRFHPYQQDVTAIYLPLSCAGCRGVCRFERPLCMAGVVPETVEEAVRYALAQKAGMPRKTLFMQAPEWTPPPLLRDLACGVTPPVWESPADFIATFKKAPGDRRLHVVLGPKP